MNFSIYIERFNGLSSKKSHFVKEIYKRAFIFVTIYDKIIMYDEFYSRLA